MTDQENALDPFERVLRVIAPLNIPDDTPLRDVIPHAWPTIGDLRRLIDALATR